jgi:hypothetical protein
VHQEKELKLFKTIIIGLLLSIINDNLNAKLSVNIRSAVIAEVKRYPELEIQDLYKLAHQAAMGNKHILADTAMALKYLEEELLSINPSPKESLIIYLRSDSLIGRVNLQAFKAHKGNSARLFEMMVRSASIFKPSISLLKSFWMDIESLASESKIQFKKSELKKYFQQMQQKGFPAVHHSKTIIENYHPTYRIVAGKQICLLQ